MNNRSTPLLGRSPKALIAAVVLAIVHQYLFYGHVLGVSYPIFIILFYAFMYHLANDRMRAPTPFGWLLLIVNLMLSMTYVLFNNSFFYVLNVLVIPPLIFIHMSYMLSARRIEWWKIRIIQDALDHLFVQSTRHFPTVFKVIRLSTFRRMNKQRKGVMSKVLLGLVIALPFLVIVINLLASADGVFNSLLSGVPGWLDQLSYSESVLRLIWVIIFGFLFFGYLWGFIKQKTYDWEKRAQAAKAQLRTDSEAAALTVQSSYQIDPIIMATVLIAFNAVYVLFVVVQFTYLFGAGQGILPEGSSYAEYARSGFVELIAVSIINFAIMMITLVFGSAQGQSALKKLNNAMLYILVGCSFVMLYSAYMRLTLYEDTFGYTYIRFLVHAFMLFLAILLIIAGFRIHYARIPLTKCYIVLGLISYVMMNYIGMDRIIASNNIERFRESGKIDVNYLTDLSTDATPLLIHFAQKEYPELQESLRNQQTDLWRDSNRAWPSFNLSHYRAERALNRYFEEEITKSH
ncbi:hypothetical protein Back11_49910 [Paenibacillus baekrokdamisoli]|uniref:Uncharacterized protein n=2 Tax=Paenibacillus baekrokdamisoli TaxID=1712516 RepID=A0A3G9IYN0_9BACL|nr:DUF4173 domain-containing protein [Paenibacillus baekrokdamisoli]BBH23646.1 hypothetical protein Back11_49910 [Paenibacillus baekrokdamisoli]